MVGSSYRILSNMWLFSGDFFQNKNQDIHSWRILLRFRWRLSQSKIAVKIGVIEKLVLTIAWIRVFWTIHREFADQQDTAISPVGSQER